jgi:beta-1,4-mannosyl-glycoprotein beta-1,4-N-acetylglucosaminyltransferase
MKPKIYDCITFFQSNLLFELRFHELKNIVDHFVVCEATKTHMGQPKKINFNYLLVIFLVAVFLNFFFLRH